MTKRVDAHHHLWRYTPQLYPQFTGTYAALGRDFNSDDLRPNLTAEGIEGSIVVQTRSSLEESVELLELASGVDFIAGVVAWADLARPDIDEQLANLKSAEGGDLLVGIRHQAEDEPDPDWLARPDVLRGIAAVGRAGLVFDLLVTPRELPAAKVAVNTHPDVKFVVDHLAKPNIKDDGFMPWSTGIADLASRENSSCKLSGLVTEGRLDAWEVDDFRRYADWAIESFGPERVMFGSDWPVCLVAASYPEVCRLAEALIAHLDERERSLIGGETACAVYGV